MPQASLAWEVGTSGAGDAEPEDARRAAGETPTLFVGVRCPAWRVLGCPAVSLDCVRGCPPLRIAPRLAAELHPSFEVLGWEDLGLFETLTEGDLYSFVGYPASRRRVRARTAESELFRYTGAAGSDGVYEETGFDPGAHVAMMFDVKGCVVGDRIQATADPYEMSGRNLLMAEERP